MTAGHEGCCCSEHGAEPWEPTSSWLGAPKAVNFLHFLIPLPFWKRRVLPRAGRGGLGRDQQDLLGITTPQASAASEEQQTEPG